MRTRSEVGNGRPAGLPCAAIDVPLSTGRVEGDGDLGARSIGARDGEGLSRTDGYGFRGGGVVVREWAVGNVVAGVDQAGDRGAAGLPAAGVIVLIRAP